MQAIVYMATNTINGNRYIGVTKRGLHVRKRQHIYDAKAGRNGCKVLYSALTKYGEESFDWVVLVECSSYEEALAEEIRLIAEMKPEYNVTLGGQGVVGVVRTPEWLENMSKSLKGRKPVRYWVGKSHSQLTKDKISAAKKGIPNIKAKGVRKIICLEDNMLFDGVAAAARYYNLGKTSIDRHLKTQKYDVHGKSFSYLDEWCVNSL